ncbi:MAG: sodium:solute symporter family protein [Saprospiraceae bacterium]|nr:Na+:solute symporter [Lewinella sp.]
MHNLDYIVIFIFSLLIILAGLSFRNSGSDMKSYFAAGGAVPWSISGLSLFMSFFSAGTFVVWGSIAYEYGLVAIIIQLSMAAAGFLVGGIIAPKWRKTGVLTVAEYIRLRLGKKVQQFYTYLILLLSLAYTGAFLYPVAKIVNVSTGFSINACILLLGLLILIYTAVGGLWAVIITDVLQFVILTVAVLIVVPLAIQSAGGLSNFVDQAPDTFFSLTNGEYTAGFIIAFVVYNTIFIGGNWAYVQRYTSVKSPQSARKVGYLFGGLYLISPIIWMLPPMLYRIINPELSGLENEGAYLLICKAVLPVGMLGLMLGGMIFATASSVNTTLNLSAAVLTNDIYKLLRPNADNRQIMKVARLSTILFGLGTIGVALLVPAAGGIVEVVLSVGAVTGCSLYGPPIWALFSKRHTGRSILACTLLALGINVIFKFVTPYTIGLKLSRAEEMLAGAIIPFALLAAYELWARMQGKTSPEAERFAARIPDEATAGETEASGRQNTYGLKVLAIMLGLVGLLIISLGAIASEERLLVILMGTVLIGLSLWMHPMVSLPKIIHHDKK